MTRQIGKRSKMWSNVAILIAALTPTIVLADNHGKGLLRRKRIAGEINLSKGNTEVHPSNGEDLWEKEAAQAELDAERLLQAYLSMSIPPQPGFPTPAPGPPLACLEGRTREEYFLDVLSPVTDAVLLRDPSTPQGQAYDWMVNQDPVFAVDPCYYPTTEQRYGLLTLYFATNGASWTNSSGWLGDSSECLWAGVVCGGESERERKLQGIPGRVYKLDLPFNNLDGTIPEEISTLYELENLNIFANSLTSRLPISLGALTRLIFLDAERNLMTGPLIPDSLLNLRNLQALRLSRNDFTGTIPPDVGGWTDLEQFWISNNAVRGSIPNEIGSLTNLKTVFFYDNELVGPIPDSLGELTEMSIIRLDGNMLTGPIPEELYQLTDLTDLRLDVNYLTGTLSTSIGRLSNLEDLRVNSNMIKGTMPSELDQVSNLKNLILYRNFFEGEVPDVFNNYQQLEQLDLSWNYLSKIIPESIFSISTIKFVYLSNNTFFGPLPSNFQEPPLLRDLYIDGNRLTGTIPAVEPGRLQELNEILFHYNLLSGSMPQSFCDLRLDAVLDDLFSDCGGPEPKVQCDFPDCCNRCFMGERPTRREIR